MTIWTSDAFIQLVIGALGTSLLLVGTFATARAATRSARITSDGPNWKGFSDNVMSRLLSVETENDKLRTRLTSLEREMAGNNRLLVLALSYIERLLDYIAERIPNDEDTPPVPPDLHERLVASVHEDWRTAPHETRGDEPPRGDDHA